MIGLAALTWLTLISVLSPVTPSPAYMNNSLNSPLTICNESSNDNIKKGFDSIQFVENWVLDLWRGWYGPILIQTELYGSLLTVHALLKLLQCGKSRGRSSCLCIINHVSVLMLFDYNRLSAWWEVFLAGGSQLLTSLIQIHGVIHNMKLDNDDMIRHISYPMLLWTVPIWYN